MLLELLTSAFERLVDNLSFVPVYHADVKIIQLKRKLDCIKTHIYLGPLQAMLYYIMSNSNVENFHYRNERSIDRWDLFRRTAACQRFFAAIALFTGLDRSDSALCVVRVWWCASIVFLA